MSQRKPKAEDQRPKAAGKKAKSLARATGRLDHTWSARNSSTRSAYEAATQNRETADWRVGLTTATAAILEGLDVMLARSRWMIRNDGYAASAQGAYRRSVVGGGITARASARHPVDGQMLKGYNAQHDLLWNAWANDPRLCDVEKTKCLYEKQALWMDELFAAGGLLLRPVYTPQADAVGLAIQELEYEQLNGDLTSYGGNAVYHGVETDRYGAPVAYHVYAAEHPLEECPSAPIRLLESECWHVFRKGRVRQLIGVPMMHAVMPSLRNLAMYEIYTLGKARTEAAFHGFIEEGAGSTATVDSIRKRLGAAAPDASASEEQPYQQLRVENGLFPVLRNGRKVTFPGNSTPNTVYPQFVQENLKRIAAGAGLDLPTIARWYADGNFNTQRRASLEIEAETEAIQDLQFINGALRRCRELWTEIAVREGKLSATGFLTSARWKAAYLLTNWQGPARKVIDEIKDQAAWDMKFKSLRGTPQQYFNERGVDPRDVLSEWKEYFELLDEYGLTGRIDAMFFKAAPNAPKAGMAPDGTGTDADPAASDPNATPDDPAELLARREVIAALIGDEGGSNGHGGNGHGRLL